MSVTLNCAEMKISMMRYRGLLYGCCHEEEHIVGFSSGSTLSKMLVKLVVIVYKSGIIERNKPEVVK